MNWPEKRDILFWTMTLFSMVASIGIIALAIGLDSERTARIEAERLVVFESATVDSIGQLMIPAKHTVGDCYGLQADISFVLADYYKHKDSL